MSNDIRPTNSCLNQDYNALFCTPSMSVTRSYPKKKHHNPSVRSSSQSIYASGKAQWPFPHNKFKWCAARVQACAVNMQRSHTRRVGVLRCRPEGLFRDRSQVRSSTLLTIVTHPVTTASPFAACANNNNSAFCGLSEFAACVSRQSSNASCTASSLSIKMKSPSSSR